MAVAVVVALSAVELDLSLTDAFADRNVPFDRT